VFHVKRNEEKDTLRDYLYDCKYALKCTNLDDKCAKFTEGSIPGPPKLGRATLPKPLPRRRARGLRPLPYPIAKGAPATSIPGYVHMGIAAHLPAAVQ
jgi:hypothetical protein